MGPHVPLKDLIRKAMQYRLQSQTVRKKDLICMCITETAASDICIHIGTLSEPSYAIPK